MLELRSESKCLLLPREQKQFICPPLSSKLLTAFVVNCPKVEIEKSIKTRREHETFHLYSFGYLFLFCDPSAFILKQKTLPKQG